MSCGIIWQKIISFCVKDRTMFPQIKFKLATSKDDILSKFKPLDFIYLSHF